MGRPRKGVRVEKLTAQISAEIKGRLDQFVREMGVSQVTTVQNALSNYLADEMGTTPSIRVPISEEMHGRLTAYAVNEQRHDPRRENIARDALNILLRTRDESQSQEFVVKLSNPSLIDRFSTYRHAREWDRSRVAEKALDRYLMEQETRDSQYREALRGKKTRPGRA
jgi:predicted transcriptional regulator